MKKAKLEEGFAAWCAEPSHNGQPNITHMNSRTQLCCEIAFKAGVEWAEQHDTRAEWQRLSDMGGYTEARFALVDLGHSPMEAINKELEYRTRRKV